MKHYLAETTDGRYFGPSLTDTREAFCAALIAYLETMPQDEATPTWLELFEVEFRSDDDFTVGDGYRKESFGTLRWDFPGVWALHPSTESPQSTPDGYDEDDPKHPTYHERMAEIWDGRER